MILGLVAMELGAGRKTKEDKIDNEEYVFDNDKYYVNIAGDIDNNAGNINPQQIHCQMTIIATL